MDSFEFTTPLIEVVDASTHAGGPLAVPASGWLMGADFAREGYDLVVSGDAGQKFIVMDYFASDTPPDLMTAENGTLRGDIVAQLAGPLNPGEYAQVGGAARSEPIGVVETLRGVAEATRADGTKVTLSQGDPIFRGDIIETGANGSVSMVMADDSVFSLDPDGTVKMDELVYDPEDQEGSMSVSLVKGVFSFVSGQIAKTDPDAMVLNTPLATVGIRGTTGVMNLPEGGRVEIVLAPDASGQTGELTIQVKDALGNPVGAPITVNIPLSAVGIAPGGAVQQFSIPAAQFQQQYQAIVSQTQNAAPAPNNGNVGNDGNGDEGGGDGDTTPADADNPDADGPPPGLISIVGNLINSAPEPEPELVIIPEPPVIDPIIVPLPEPPPIIDPPQPEPLPIVGSFNDIQTPGGSVTVSLTSGNDRVWGTSGFDNVTLMGTAQSGDVVDLMGYPSDQLNLYPGNNVLSVANTETIWGNEGGGNDIITVTTPFVGSGNSINLDSGTDTVNLAAGGNSVSITSVENINGGSGSDALTYTGGINFAGTTFSSIESILFGTMSAGSTLSMDGATNFGVTGPCLTIDGTSGGLLSSSAGMDLSDVTLMNVASLTLDTSEGTASPVNLLVDSNTNLNGANVVNDSATNLHIDSANGMSLAGSSLFTGVASTHSIIIDSGADNSGAILTVDDSTVFTNGGTTQIYSQDGGGGNSNDIITSNNGINFAAGNGTIQFGEGISIVNFNADGGASSTLTLNQLGTYDNATLNGGSGGNDVISLNSSGTYNLSSNVITNVASITGSSGVDSLTLGSVPSGLSIDLGAMSDTLNLSGGNDTVTVANVEALDAGAGNDSVTVSSADLSGKAYDGGDGTADALMISGGAAGSENFGLITDWESWVLSSASSYTFNLEDGNVTTGTLSIDGSAASAMTISAASELTETINITGSGGNDTLTAGGAGGAINGGAGNDNLIGGAGVDNLDGGGGSDALNGGANADVLNGGTGSDTFRYTAISDSTSAMRDVISDFDATDDSEDIVLVGIAAAVSFVFIGAETTVFSGGADSAEARFNDTTKILEIDSDGDGSADMEITLTGVEINNLDNADFSATAS